MNLPVLQAGVFVAAILLTGLFIVIARRIKLLDAPSSRSAHSIPTPVGGGITVVLLFSLVSLYCLNSGLLTNNQFLALCGGLVVAGIGLVDDGMQLNLRWRLPVQLLAAVWSVFWLGDIPAINFGGFFLAQVWLLKLLSVLALLWLLNLYNFMDGIDGLAGSEVVFVTFMTFLLLINTRHEGLVILSAALMASGAGFLVWNWAPAKVFMGDVGSSFIGFTLGIMALMAMQDGALTVWTWFILLNVFVVDATVTLFRRATRGQRWYEGHASHAYQHAARHFRSHSKVTILITGINCLWLAPLAWISVVQPRAGFYLSLLAILPLLVLAWKLGAGTRQESPGQINE